MVQYVSRGVTKILDHTLLLHQKSASMWMVFEGIWWGLQRHTKKMQWAHISGDQMWSVVEGLSVPKASVDGIVAASHWRLLKTLCMQFVL